ncbi:hypothetical protein [Pseudomonas panipatensis]|uniref:hypothetical protein n=1 Tax=Pseudomonas panipatensis TaxID=428992 RepID=UPI0035B0A8D7
MFTKTGNVFPDAEHYAKQIASALHAELGATHRASKILMRWTNASERTVKNWLAGTSGPRGEHLIALIAHSDAALKAFLSMAGRSHALLAAELHNLRPCLLAALEGIDALMQQKPKA